MKIYFLGSIQGGREDQQLYHTLISHLSGYGTVLTAHVGDSALSKEGEKLDHGYVHARDMGWLRECDVVIGEVTVPSLGVGYEIGKAEEWGKPILCLFRLHTGRTLSSLIDGSPATLTKFYTDEAEALRIIDEYMKDMKK